MEFEVIENGIHQRWLDEFATVSRGESKVIGTYWRDATWIEAGLNLWTLSSPFRAICPQSTVTDLWCSQTEMRRYRRSKFGRKVILQVECEKKGRPRGTTSFLTISKLWRDAVVTDVNLEEDGQQKILRFRTQDTLVIEYDHRDYKEEKEE